MNCYTKTFSEWFSRCHLFVIHQLRLLSHTGNVHSSDRCFIITARLVDRIEIGNEYEIEIKFRISVEQYMRIAA